MKPRVLQAFERSGSNIKVVLNLPNGFWQQRKAIPEKNREIFIPNPLFVM
jgi:hypothetical protein